MTHISRLGIYGGTFAPVHNGHIGAARAFLESGLCDLLLIMPTFLPPHKTLSFCDNPYDRISMLKLAFSELSHDYPDKLRIDDYEVKKNNISYSIETVRHYAQYCDTLILLCGTDMFLSIDRWYEAHSLLSMCEIAYDKRTNDSEDARAMQTQAQHLHRSYGTICHAIDAPVIQISSTDLRGRIARGEDVSAYLHPEVIQYIDQHGLYRDI